MQIINNNLGQCYIFLRPNLFSKQAEFLAKVFKSNFIFWEKKQEKKLYVLFSQYYHVYRGGDFLEKRISTFSYLQLCTKKENNFFSNFAIKQIANLEVPFTRI